jgi:hypothetical protein
MLKYLGEEGLGRVQFLACRANEQGFVLSDKLLETFYWTDIFDRVFTSMWGHRYADERKNRVLYLHYLIDGMIASQSIAIPVLQTYAPIPEEHRKMKDIFTNVDRISPIFEQPKPIIPDFLLPEASSTAKFKVLECSELLLTIFSRLSNLPWEGTVYGKYFESPAAINSVTQSIRRLRRVEPSADYQKFLLLHDGREIRFCPFTFVDAFCAGPTSATTEGLVTPVRLQVIDRQRYFTEYEIEQFEWILNQAKTTERDLQRFFEANPKFLLDYEYRHLHPQVILAPESSDSRIQIPDFFLERNGTGFVDIFELKHPWARVLVGPKGRARFSAAIHAALGQLREYEEFSRSAEVRRPFQARYGFEGYEPKICVIVGRSERFYTELEKDEVQEEYTRLKVLTYDDILLRARNFRYF